MGQPHPRGSRQACFGRHPKPFDLKACRALVRKVPAPIKVKWGHFLPGPQIRNVGKKKLTCFHASFFPFCPLCWPPLFLPFSRHIFALFSPSKTALFCRAKGTAQSLERGQIQDGPLQQVREGNSFLKSG